VVVDVEAAIVVTGDGEPGAGRGVVGTVVVGVAEEWGDALEIKSREAAEAEAETGEWWASLTRFIKAGVGGCAGGGGVWPSCGEGAVNGNRSYTPG